MKEDLQLVVPNVPTDSFDKGEIDYELILQVPLPSLTTQLLRSLNSCLLEVQNGKMDITQDP
jgi:hypothetical protein